MTGELGQGTQRAEHTDERPAAADFDQIGIKQCRPHLGDARVDDDGEFVRHVERWEELLGELAGHA